MSKRPFFKVVILFCLIVFSFSFPLYAEQKVRVIKKDAELKTLPQVESLTIARLPLGGEYSIAERISEEWIKISLPPDEGGIVQSGYAQVSFLQFIDVPEGRGESKDTKTVQEDAPKEINPNVHKNKYSFGLGIDAGVSIITSANGKSWNTGLFLSGNFSFHLIPNLSLGLQASYHRWTPNVEELKKGVDLSGSTDVAVSGGVTYFEIMPYLRVPIYKREGIELFVQGGGGVTFIRLNTRLRVFYGWASLNYTVSDSATRPGIFFALGVRLGNIGKIRYQATVQYHNTFIAGGSTGYVAFGVGGLF
jgi:hypothetical protein